MDDPKHMRILTVNGGIALCYGVPKLCKSFLSKHALTSFRPM